MKENIALYLKDKTADKLTKEIFTQKAESLKLDPLSKEIQLFERNGVWVIIVSLEGYRKVVMEYYKEISNQFSISQPIYGRLKSHLFKIREWNEDTKEWCIQYKIKDVPESCTIRLHLQSQDFANFTSVVFFDEFIPEFNQEFFYRMPHHMIARVCEAQVYKKALPTLSGTYAEEELDNFHKMPQDKKGLKALTEVEINKAKELINAIDLQKPETVKIAKTKLNRLDVSGVVPNDKLRELKDLLVNKVK